MSMCCVDFVLRKYTTKLAAIYIWNKGIEKGSNLLIPELTSDRTRRDCCKDIFSFWERNHAYIGEK